MAYLLLIPTAAAQAPTHTIPYLPSVPTKTELQADAVSVAHQHGFDDAETAQFIGTVNWENRDWDCTLQSHDYNARDGGRELSFGLAMIHLPDHPTVSLSQAKNCLFSLNWMAEQWVLGNQHEWTGYRMQYSKK